MTQKSCLIQFPATNYQSITLLKDTQISEHLTVQNSPVLFGCRTGICGTCLVLVEGDIPPPNIEEKEMLEILAPDNPQARLACQIQLINDLKITAIKIDEV